MMDNHEKKVKHLEFIQNIITRMNGNSFLVKSWTVPLVSALFALAAKDENMKFVLITYFTVPAFWILDGYFLSRERRFVSLYQKVIALNDDTTVTDYSMDIKKASTPREWWISAIFSWTLILFYGICLCVTILVMCFPHLILRH